MPEAINTFTDKIISDLDTSVITPQQWVFPTMNVRVFNKDGKGFIASTLPGNELLFSLSEGFVFLGANDYNGILYLASHNETTGMGELGTYPKSDKTKFVESYGPLQNFKVNSIGNFRTIRFNFDLDHLVDIILKVSYDDSVDIYMCDWKNPNRVINSGFDRTGKTNNRFYVDGNFDGSINQIPFSIKDIIQDSNKDIVAIGGTLRPGNYYLYLRYLTADYARTNFVKEIGPISILQGNTVRNESGVQEKDWLQNVVLKTDKKITLCLSNIDTNYAYLEVGIARYTAMTEGSVYTKDTYLIDKYYPLNNIPSSGLLITIYGNETQKLITYDELIRDANEYNICRSQTQMLDRWLGVNWKKADLKYQKNALRTFAEKIVIGSFQNNTILGANSPTIDDLMNNIVALGPYADGNKIIKYVGYFKNQIYPFAVQFEFDNGSLSDWYPCKGQLDIPGNEYKGLYKFPSWQDASNVYGKVSQKYVTGVSFNVTEAFKYYRDNSDKAGNFGSIVGFRFGRGDRVDNLVCQGVMFRGFYGVHIDTTDMTFQTAGAPSGSGGNTSGNDPDTASIIPLFRGGYPLVKTDSSEWWKYGATGEISAVVIDKSAVTHPNRTTFFDPTYNNDCNHKHGIFSPDLLFDNNVSIQESAFIEPLFTFANNDPGASVHLQMDPYVRKEEGDFLPMEYALDLNEDIIPGAMVLSPNYGATCPVYSTFVDGGQYNGKYHFCSYMTGAGDGMGIDMNSTWYNRNIFTSRYAGIMDMTPNKSLRQLYGTETLEKYSIVNLYKVENNLDFHTSTRNAFNVASSLYAPISEIILKSKFISMITGEGIVYPISIFKGDCFLQKTWFRQSRWKAMEKHGDSDSGTLIGVGYGGSMLDDGGNYYQHGLMVGIITENKINSEARNDVTGKDDMATYVRYSSYPKVLSEGITASMWARKEAGAYLVEALQVNDGYNHLLSDHKGLGFDITEPVHVENKPNRTYVSDVHTAGSFTDGYRQIAIGAFRDYGLDSGPIVGIYAVLDYPVLVHEKGINQLYLNEKAVAAGASGDFILGTSATFLGDRLRKMADYGSQHKPSIISGKKGIYGWDFFSRIAWRIDRQEGKGGGFYLNCEELSTSKLVQSWIKELMDGYSTQFDAMNQLPDLPLRGMGIVAGVDKEFGEIIFSFLMNKNGRIDRTLVFDETLDGFKGEYSFVEPSYCSLGNMLVSPKHYLDDDFIYRVGNEMYRYNVVVTKAGVSNYNTFFGIPGTMQLSFIVNGMTQDPQSNTSKLDKIFEGLIIESKAHLLSRVLYETLYQKGTWSFQTDGTDFWLDAEYLLHKWHVPVTVQDSPTDEQFDLDGEMKGMWMKVTIEYKGTSDLEIKSVQTNFNILTP